MAKAPVQQPAATARSTAFFLRIVASRGKSARLAQPGSRATIEGNPSICGNSLSCEVVYEPLDDFVPGSTSPPRCPTTSHFVESKPSPRFGGLIMGILFFDRESPRRAELPREANFFHMVNTSPWVRRAELVFTQQARYLVLRLQ